MITKDMECIWNYDVPINSFGWNQDDIFLDIETTGLSFRSSHIYLIGAIFYDKSKERLILRQWFLDQPAKEKELLSSLQEFLRPGKRLIHYNGSSFDLPYLSHKFDFYQLENPIRSCSSLDLYQLLHPFQKLFGLPSMRQKDLETLMNCHREDTFSGGELISVYQNYLQSGEEKLFLALIKHNQEDLTGMLSLFPLLAIPKLVDGTFFVEKAVYNDEELLLFLKSDCPVVFSLTAAGSFCKLQVDNGNCMLRIPSSFGVMKYFFKDYRQYFYLPEEDTAIHKSVGAYVDPEHRQKAKACNCYQKKEGVFLPQPEPVFTPCFYESYKGFPGYFQWSESLSEQKELQHQYSVLMLQYLFKKDYPVYSFGSGDL